jgi:hypothetical protein
MTAPDPAHSLGVYMRVVARHLSHTVSMSFDEALSSHHRTWDTQQLRSSD